MSGSIAHGKQDRQNRIWPLPPTCGVLGAALVWYVHTPHGAHEAVCEVLSRHLTLQGIEPTTADAAVTTIVELVADAARHCASAVFIEIAHRPDALAVAIRQAAPTPGVTGPQNSNADASPTRVAVIPLSGSNRPTHRVLPTQRSANPAAGA